jgi:type IV pilus assembly protein PilA
MVASASLNYNYGDLLPVQERRKKSKRRRSLRVTYDRPNETGRAPKSAMGDESGFTLVELLIVIVVTMMLALIAVPKLLHSRLAANEATAISSIQNINRAEVSYRSTYPARGFAANLADLGGAKPCIPRPSCACLIDTRLGEGAMSGYNFAAFGSRQAANGAYQDYTAAAAPAAYGQSGVRLFCSMSDAILRYSANLTHSTTPPNATECLSETVLE